MLYLAVNSNKNTIITIEEIAENQDISKKYLELIVRMLVSYGLIKSIKGKNGGIMLGSPPSEIKFSDILQASEGQIALVDCVHKPYTCKRSEKCLAR
jgi:Rrf2 family protein